MRCRSRRSRSCRPDTTAAVALIGWKLAGLPLAAAIALGAIVAPPDAAAAAAVLRQFRPPRRLMAVLQGESLLNDANRAAGLSDGLSSQRTGVLVLGSAIPILALSTIGSIVAGYVLARLFRLAMTRVDDAATATILQFVSTFGVWIFADRLGLSAIITMVVYAITLARSALAHRLAAQPRQLLFGPGDRGVCAQRARLRAHGITGQTDPGPAFRSRPAWKRSSWAS